MLDMHIGKPGTPARDKFEMDFSMTLLGSAIREARMRRNLTQEELGKLVGVKKAQISKLEQSAKNTSVETILRVFGAVGARITFSVELQNKRIKAA